MDLFQDKSFFIKVASVGQEAGTGENWDDGLNHETHHIFTTYTDSAINSIQTVYKQRGSSVISDRHGRDGTNFTSIHGRSSSIRLMSLGVYVDTRMKHHLHPRINLHQLAAEGSCHSVRRWL